MTWALEPFALESGNLRLRNLREEDLPEASRVLADPEGWSGRTWGAGTEAGALKFLQGRLAAHARGESLPLIYFLDGAVAGVTGLHSACERRKAVEIGFTSVAPAFRRSAANTRVKTLLLHHCFGALGAVRVELRVDARNYVSQTAVLRLGARFDGRIDHWVVREGDPHPVGHIYSVTLDRWPAVRERLAALLAGHAPPEPFLAACLEGPRLRVARSKLADAAEFLALAQRDPASVRASFPQLARLAAVDDAKGFIAQRAHAAAEGSGFHYLARDRASAALVGHVQIKSVDWQRGSGELGYLIAPEFRGRGYGTELLTLVLRELGRLTRLTVRVLPENTASLAVARKLGFREEGILRSEHLTAAGERRDVVLLGLTRLPAAQETVSLQQSQCGSALVAQGMVR